MRRSTNHTCGRILSSLGIVLSFSTAFIATRPISFTTTRMKAGLFGDIFGGNKAQPVSWSPNTLQELEQRGSLLPPSWNELDRLLRAVETKSERDEYDLISAGTGRGPSSHRANLRLFDAPDGFEPEVTLFRDTAGWCPYCQKVWLQLEGTVAFIFISTVDCK
jgi:hypothetical protein